jgi:hypothetical protein
VDTADVQSLKNGFGDLSGETEFKDKSDFKQDGINDVEDFSQMSRSFGAFGAYQLVEQDSGQNSLSIVDTLSRRVHNTARRKASMKLY